MTQVVLELPDELANEAKAAGLLTSAQVSRLLQAEIERRQKVDKYFEMMNALHQLEPPMTQAEIDTELAEWKAERRAV
ncbi:MAG: hypothetical protein J5J04_00885 [Anaerolineae bacterium]|jgi:hypothetical protein|nr:MAG: hypothetical protein UZ13_02666 [Chloroflexi bacterium OLB13]MBC6957521.1 hypothetical protein [Chloroflexota bacterium]MBV6436489.1 hypothetical protein [Anaerolineae bacterium]MDL1917210.1 hypothetical protein [Anaerolineae bacterium CFX4]OQY80539.1 MAG: hypothetical protein B6D42_12910 [Anaerolineae bacterium UTCFX5]